MTATRAATASKTPQLDRNQVGFAGDGTLAPEGPDIVSMVAMRIPPSLQQLRCTRSDLGGDHLRKIKQAVRTILWRLHDLAAPQLVVSRTVSRQSDQGP